MAVGAVDICNSALIKVGAQRITLLTDSSKEAKVCNEHYENVRDALLASHPWNFAIERVSLGLLVEEPEFDFDNYFQVPKDCLRVLTVYPKEYDYQIEGRKLASDASDVKIKYITKITDTTKFSTFFEDALSWDLAGQIAYALTQSTSFTELMMRKAEEKVALARTFDAQEGSSILVESDDFYNFRF